MINLFILIFRRIIHYFIAYDEKKSIVERFILKRKKKIYTVGLLIIEVYLFIIISLREVWECWGEVPLQWRIYPLYKIPFSIIPLIYYFNFKMYYVSGMWKLGRETFPEVRVIVTADVYYNWICSYTFKRPACKTLDFIIKFYYSYIFIYLTVIYALKFILKPYLLNLYNRSIQNWFLLDLQMWYYLERVIFYFFKKILWRILLISTEPRRFFFYKFNSSVMVWAHNKKHYWLYYNIFDYSPKPSYYIIKLNKKELDVIKQRQMEYKKRRDDYYYMNEELNSFRNKKTVRTIIRILYGSDA